MEKRWREAKEAGEAKEKTIKELKNRISGVEEQLFKLKKELEKTQQGSQKEAQRQKAEKEKLEKKLQEIQEKAEETSENFLAVSMDLTQTKEEYLTQKKLLEVKTSEYQTLLSQHDVLLKEKKSCLEEIDNLTRAMENLKPKGTDLNNLKVVQQRLRELEQDYDTALEKIRSLENQNKVLREESDVLIEANQKKVDHERIIKQLEEEKVMLTQQLETQQMKLDANNIYFNDTNDYHIDTPTEPKKASSFLNDSTDDILKEIIQQYLDDNHRLEQELTQLKVIYFHSVAVTTKMNFVASGVACNVDIPSIVDRAITERVPVSGFPRWIGHMLKSEK